jgi:PAS domain S-box-containing protein
MSAPDAFQEKIVQLKAAFVEGLPARLAEIAAAQNAFVNSLGAAQAASLKTLVGQAHKLAGSAGTFGFPELGIAARELDIHGTELLKSGAPLDSGAIHRIAELVARIVSSSPVAPIPTPSVAPAAAERGEGAAAVQSRPEIGRSFERALLHRRGLTYAPLLLTALGVLLAGVYANHLNEKRFGADQRLVVSDKLAIIRSNLEGHISGNINLVKGLVAAISTEPNLSQERYAALAELLLAGKSQLRNIAAAPGLVIRYMYPLEGNERAVGLDLGGHPGQREAALRARDTGELILAGPVALVQGGEGFVGRIPVFVGPGTGRERTFWGLISAVIDSTSLYQAAGLLDQSLPIEIAIRGKDTLGPKGALFHGRNEVFASDPVLATVTLPHGSWQMAAVPKGGWPRRADNAWTLRLGFLLGGTLVVLSVGLATWLSRKRQESLDALRASSARFRDLTEMSSDWFWEAGPDGRFTFFSEGFTRATGHAPNRLLGKTREDFVVRFSGDEEMWERHRRTLAARQPFRTLRYRYRRADGALGWTAVAGKPIFAADGSFRGYRGGSREITKEMAAERALIEAREKAADAERRLRAAIEALDSAFVIYDADDRLVLCNTKYKEFYSAAADLLVAGAKFEDIVRAAAKRGQIVAAVGRIDEWVAERMRMHRSGGVIEEKMSDGRWIRITAHKTPDGSTVGLRTDITAIKEAQESADKANQAKSEFLSSMSHELRTPLNAILGFGQLLQYNPKEPLTDAQANSVRIILKGGEHLLNLINEVLDLAKIEAGRTTLSIENVSIGTLFGEVRPLIEPMAEKAKIALEMILPERDVLIWADYTRTKQVLLNLLSNAVKYNFEGGRVTVRAVSSPGDKLRLSVADTGPGIPAEKQSELFQPFNRLGAETTEIEGTGIGLALSKKLVEMMGGAIGCESEIGVGSTFWVDLPLAGRPARTVREKEPVAVKKNMGGRLPAVTGTILYIEDNPDNLGLMEAIFSDVEGATLLSAHNAELGLSLAVDRKPDAIVMDINLPGMNGFEALKHLMNNKATRAIPVIALSANATARDIEKGEKAGFYRYLTKPVDLEQLMRCLWEVMGKGP